MNTRTEEARSLREQEVLPTEEWVPVGAVRRLPWQGGVCAWSAAPRAPGVSCSLLRVGAHSAPRPQGSGLCARPADWGQGRVAVKTWFLCSYQHRFHMVVIHHIFVQLMKREKFRAVINPLFFFKL